MCARVLICGVPGTGKTTLGQHFAARGFTHIDMEARGFRRAYEFSSDPDGFISALPAGDVVLTWGFGPFSNRACVQRLMDCGFRAVWLDGDRVASFREFMRREGHEPVRECEYYGQMQMIMATEIVQRLALPVVCPFGSDGQFRAVEELAADVLSAIAGEFWFSPVYARSASGA